MNKKDILVRSAGYRSNTRILSFSFVFYSVILIFLYYRDESVFKVFQIEFILFLPQLVIWIYYYYHYLYDVQKENVLVATALKLGDSIFRAEGWILFRVLSGEIIGKSKRKGSLKPTSKNDYVFRYFRCMDWGPQTGYVKITYLKGSKLVLKQEAVTLEEKVLSDENEKDDSLIHSAYNVKERVEQVIKSLFYGLYRSIIIWLIANIVLLLWLKIVYKEINFIW